MSWEDGTLSWKVTTGLDEQSRIGVVVGSGRWSCCRQAPLSAGGA